MNAPFPPHALSAHPLQLLLPATAAAAGGSNAPGVLALPNDADPLLPALQGVTRIELSFPKFTDGRAFSQAIMLRRRRGFRGDIRATGDVLVDQLAQMQRCGFSSAVLRADQCPAVAARQLARFAAFYQGDASHPQPHFRAGCGPREEAA